MMFEILLILATVIIFMLAWASYRLGEMYYEETHRAEFWKNEYRKLWEQQHE
jgi:hypothetical protein